MKTEDQVKNIIQLAEIAISAITKKPYSLLIVPKRKKTKSVIPLHWIIELSARYFNTTPELIRGDSRKGELVIARRYVSYYCRNVLKRITFKSIAEEMGNRDHATIMQHIKKMAEIMAYSKGLRHDFDCFCKFIDDEIDNYLNDIDIVTK